MSGLSVQQREALKAIVSAVVEAVAAAGEAGAPAGVLYAGLMQYGCKKSQFDSLMPALVRAGKLRQEGHLYFVVRASHANV